MSQRKLGNGATVSDGLPQDDYHITMAGALILVRELQKIHRSVRRNQKDCKEGTVVEELG